ncbi:hypothetical protein FOL46_000039 [Perkinsus olseni]|uniref:Uncharacterized protein n=1 Tax=Perkinsus olseni TaxID=32597 RepID=A0A7J6MZ06_PEROL|nr:hypothetical protein FOL46_000039 [Perkinsus olseni]
MPGRSVSISSRRVVERPVAAVVTKVGGRTAPLEGSDTVMNVPNDPSQPTVLSPGHSSVPAPSSSQSQQLAHREGSAVAEISREDTWRQRVPFRNPMEMHVLAVQKLASGGAPAAEARTGRVNLLEEVDWGRVPPTWEGLKPTTLKMAENLTVRQIAILLNAYAKAGVADRQVFYTLTQQFSARLGSSPKSVFGVRPQDVGLVAHACQKVQFKNEFLFTRLRKVVVRMVKQNRQISPQTLSLILTGFVKLKFIGDGELLHSLGTAALRELDRFTIRDSAVLMMTFSQACPLDDRSRDVFSRVYRARDRTAERESMAAAVPIMVALSNLTVWHPEVVMDLLQEDYGVVDAFAAAVPTCAIVHLANGIQALATLVAGGFLPASIGSRAVFRAASDRLCEDGGAKLPQSAVVQLTAGFTKLGGLGWQDIFNRLLVDATGLDLPSAVAVLHGLAGQNIRDVSWVEREILNRLDEAKLRDPQTACMLLYGLARLGMPAEAARTCRLVNERVLRGLGVQGLSNLVYAVASVWHACGLSIEEQEAAAAVLLMGLERLSIVGSEEDQRRFSMEIAGQLRVVAQLSMASLAEGISMDLLLWTGRLIHWSACQKPSAVKSSLLHKEVADTIRLVVLDYCQVAEEVGETVMATTAESTASSGGPPIDTFAGPAFGFLANDHESPVRAFCPGRDKTTSFAEFPTAASAITAMREGLDPAVWKKHPELADELVATGKRSLLFDCSPEDSEALEAQGFPSDEGVFWGCSRDTGSLKGQNQFGRILSTIRTDIQDSEDVARQLWLHAVMNVVKQDTASPIRVTEVKEGRSVATHRVANAVCVMGKVESCDVVALHPSTSRHHAMLVYAAGVRNPTDSKWRENTLDQVYALDLHSKFGTFVGEKGDVKMEPFLPQVLGKRDQLRLGASTRHYEIKVDHGAALAELKKMEYKLDKEIRDMGGKIDNPLKEAEEERSKSSTVYMGNLSYTTTKESIEKFFKEEDLKVCGVRLPGGEDKVASRGFAFVEFSREADMRNAIALLDGATLDTRKAPEEIRQQKHGP